MRCLGCYQELQGTSTEFHSVCARRIFGTGEPPIVDVDIAHMRERSIEVPIHGAMPGVQPKISVARAQNDRRRLTLVGFKGEYILKPASIQYSELPENEDLTMHLAEIVGIRTARHALIRTPHGDLAYITRRFDRKFRGRKIQRFAVEDMCQLSGKLTENKYQGSMELVARNLRKYSTYPALDARTFFELTLFSYLTGNSDMHLKNFSLMTNEKNIVAFSPAYDLLAVKLVVPADAEELALTLNRKKQNLTRRDMDTLAEYCELSLTTRDSVYNQMRKALTPMLRLIGQSFLSETMQDRYTIMLRDRATKMSLA